ncbi:mechanosensitive ion channel protein 1, mitochondrial-like [Cornus florida]|uniref:mechanosensitive ion channel protein 1, mitochondrial-like n=1 Tax=Cornus florida TaxID=4283 RepID=UPI002898E573|nr:mechanosensitive ion channel protein 1, mitochondrial-like [Cornus florida]XP_059651370.1 mechanosensitive ion channel protein 1, mitochondrial-like [Cornus florida]
MAASRFLIWKSRFSTTVNRSFKAQSCRSFDSCMKFEKCADPIDARPLFTCINRNFHAEQSGFTENNVNSRLGSVVDNQYYRNNHFRALSPTLLNSRQWRSVSVVPVSPTLNYRWFSSSVGSQGDNARGGEVPSASGVTGSDNGDAGLSGSDIIDKVKDVWQSTIDTVTYTGQRTKEASDELTPHVQQLLDTHPYLRDVIVPVGSTLTATILAWVVMPRLLRRLHKYAMQGPASFLSGSTLFGQVPYEKSFWGALEDPIRYLITFMAFTQIGMMVAPSTIASQYLAQAWRGAVILSLVWFLQRWKTNVITRALTVQSTVVDREKLLTLDKLSSIGLFVLGLMALAESCGVAVQSILTVGGIGGVATAFAAKDVLGNVLSGLSVQLSHPFSVGETIKAGSVEGQVVEMGLTTTSLLSAEKYPIIVPNSLFSSQVIVNKSRAQWRAIITKIPLQIGDFEKIPQISDDIKSMLRSNSNIFLGKEAPYCFLSRIERSFAELTLGCNLKHMSKEEFFSTQQDILLQSVQIIKKHGATLGSTLEDMTY